MSITTNDAAVATTCACGLSTAGNATGIGPAGNELVGVFCVGGVLGVLGDEPDVDGRLEVPLDVDDPLPGAELLLGASREPHANTTDTDARASERITARRYH